MTQAAVKINTPNQYLPFEQEVAQIDRDIEKLRTEKGKDNSAEIRKLQRRQTKLLKSIYSSLTPWQTVQVSRHPERPIFPDYLSMMIKDPRELHGDRTFGDDRAILAILGQVGRHRVMVIGQNKGRDTKEKISCNFGCPNPEGYRKALLKMKLAEKFNLPIVTFIDTPGAYPGIGAEERGQAQAIAKNLMEMSRLRVPVISVVIGEGGSGGALGIGVADRMAILENAYYSVISPEGCAAILWRDGTKTQEASKALKLTGKDLIKLKLVDHVIPEPLGGAHRNIHDTIYNVEQYLNQSLSHLKMMPIEKLLHQRHEKLRKLGSAFIDSTKPVDTAPPQPAPQKPKLPDRVSVEVQLRQTQDFITEELAAFAEHNSSS